MNAPTLDEFTQAIQDNEIVNAAVTEAIHRFYFDKCFGNDGRPFDTPEVKTIFEILQYMDIKYAGWRYTLGVQLPEHLKRYSIPDSPTRLCWLDMRPGRSVQKTPIRIG